MSWLDAPVTSIALCWQIERRGGVGLGLTAHDRDLVIDGNLYRASPGLTPSAIEHGEGDGSMDASGALTSGAIGEADLLAGRWDGARVAVFAVDWTDTSRRVALGEGAIGAVETRNGSFTAELKGSAAALDRAATEETSPECRAELGDRRCRVAMAGRRRFGSVIAADDEVLTLSVAEPVANGWGGGRLRWFGGANAGLEERIVASGGTQVTLAVPPRLRPEPGDRVEVIEGCDKSLATCSARFNNAANFRGEPYLPGIDLLTRYPGA